MRHHLRRDAARGVGEGDADPAGGCLLGRGDDPHHAGSIGWLPGEGITVRNLGEGLLLTGEVSTTAVATRAKAMADRFAPDAVTSGLTVRASQQVILEVRILEAGRSDLKDVGFDLNASDGSGFALRTGSGLNGNSTAQGGLSLSGSIGNVGIDVVLKALEEDRNAILFIDEIHMIMGAGSGGGSSMDAANMIKPVLGKGRLLTIGATTPDEFAKSFEKDHALMRRFAKLDIKETDVESTKLIVRGLKEHYEKFHGVMYSDEILDKAVDLTDRYVKTRYFPDKALDVIDAAGATVKLRGDTEVLMKDMVSVVGKIGKISADVVDIEKNDTYVNLADRLGAKVFGQHDAIEHLVEAILVSKSGLRESNKPVGSFLFVGPSGTGKTELCRTLATELQCELVKFDMSEYQERHSVSKLIGAPPGYVGHAEGHQGQGQLLAAIEDTPNCVLLLDEIEKAAPEVIQILLQVMDDGVLTGSTGKKVDFSSVVLVMTSNLGAAASDKLKIGFGDNIKNGEVDSAVKAFFTPEFRNRLDAVVKFNKLDQSLMINIVRRLVKESNELLNKNQSTVRMELTEMAMTQLSQEGYDPSMGARPLKRVFENRIKKPLSKKILFEGLNNCIVNISYEKDEYTFTI
jgi:ATP-dependent Clp protease ATP-binding subunit ClpA